MQDILDMTVPIVVETSGRTERAYDIFSRLLKDRIVLLGSEVNDAVASLICAQLLFLESQDPEKEIYLYINSPGGSVTAGMAIYDTMNYITPPIATVCMGRAASMGAFLLSAGQKGMRYALPNSQVMIHQPSADSRDRPPTSTSMPARSCVCARPSTGCWRSIPASPSKRSPRIPNATTS